MALSDYPESYFELTPAKYRALLVEFKVVTTENVRLRQRRRVDEDETARLAAVVEDLQAQVSKLRVKRGVRSDEFVAVMERFGVEWRRTFWDDDGRRLPHPERRFIDAVRSAIDERGKSWTISPTMYARLVAKPCESCGGPVGGGVGLDRIDHDAGYSVENVRPCCGPCNLQRGRRKSL